MMAPTTVTATVTRPPNDTADDNPAISPSLGKNSSNHDLSHRLMVRSVASLWQLLIQCWKECTPEDLHLVSRSHELSTTLSSQSQQRSLARSHQLNRLMYEESQLEGSVQRLDEIIRCREERRRNMETQRANTVSTLDELGAMYQAVLAEIQEFENELASWRKRFGVAWNRHRMAAQDLTQLERHQRTLETQQMDSINRVSSTQHELDELRIRRDELKCACEREESKKEDIGRIHNETEEAITSILAVLASVRSDCASLSTHVAAGNNAALHKAIERILVSRTVHSMQAPLQRSKRLMAQEEKVIADAEQQAKQVHQRIHIMQQIQVEVGQQVAEQEKHKAHLKGQHMECMKRIDHDKHETARLRSACDETTAAIVHINGESDRLQGQLNGESKELKKGEHRLKAATDAVIALDDLLRAARDEQSLLLRGVVLLEGERSSLSSSLANHSHSIHHWDSIIEQRIEEMKMKIEEMEKAIVERQETASQHQQSTIQLKQKQLDLGDEMLTLQATLDSSTAITHELQSRLNGLVSISSDTDGDVSSISIDLAECESQRAAAQERLKTMRAEHDAEMDALRQKIQQCKKQAKENADRVTEANKLMSIVRASERHGMNDYELELVRLQQAVTGIEVDRELNGENEKKWRQEESKRHIQYQQHIHDKDSQIQEAGEQTAALTSRLHAAQDRRVIEESRMGDLNNKMEDARTKLKQRSDELSSLRSSVLMDEQLQRDGKLADPKLRSMLEESLRINVELSDKKNSYESVGVRGVDPSRSVDAQVQTYG